MDLRRPTAKRRWTSNFPPPVTSAIYAGLLAAFVEDVETQCPVTSPVVQAAKDVAGAVRNRDYNRAIDYAEAAAQQMYSSTEEQFFSAQLAALVVKMPFTGPDFAPERRAWEKFQAAEESCREANQRLKGWNPYEQYFQHARGWILRTIGEEPDLQEISKCCGFGPGASVGVHGNTTHAGRKLSVSKWTVTPTCSSYARAFMSGDAHIWEQLIPCHQPHPQALRAFGAAFGERLEYIDYNKITLVPKKAKVHRTIAIEPLLNGYVQKGIDMFLRSCLLRVGIDLSDQTFNQRLALLGSKGGIDPVVTIDLSAASDSVSREIVRTLLPPAWYDLLNNTRSPCYLTEAGDIVRYEKFVSMGNGFCFPLETLIFASLSSAVYEMHKPRTGVFSVYGDDIIVHQSVALILLEILRYAGFEPNDQKTFITGPFRESCGADYFGGINIRPYTLSEWPQSSVALFKILNGIREVPYTFLQHVWDYAFSRLPPDAMLLRPQSGPPDTAVEVPMDVFMGSRYAQWSRRYQRWNWRELLHTPIEDSTVFDSGAMMYGLLRSLRPNKVGKPSFALRRETRTSVRWLLD